MLICFPPIPSRLFFFINFQKKSFLSNKGRKLVVPPFFLFFHFLKNRHSKVYNGTKRFCLHTNIASAKKLQSYLLYFHTEKLTAFVFLSESWNIDTPLFLCFFLNTNFIKPFRFCQHLFPQQCAQNGKLVQHYSIPF